MVVTDPDQYEEYLEEVVENREKYDPSPPEFVANVCVLSIAYGFDDEIVMRTVAEPYHNDRITPGAVIYAQNNRDLRVSRKEDTLRGVAVQLLAADIEARIDDE